MTIPVRTFQADDLHVYIDGKIIRDAHGYDMNEKCAYVPMCDEYGRKLLFKNQPMLEPVYGLVVMVVPQVIYVQS